MPKKKKPRESPLFDDVKGTKARNLRSSVEKVDALTPEEEADLERGGVFASRGTKRRIARNCMWVGFGFGVVSVAGLGIALLTILGFYVREVIETGSTGEVITGMFEFLFGVAATVAVEYVLLRNRPKD